LKKKLKLVERGEYKVKKELLVSEKLKKLQQIQREI
jgi:hypothetical protein